MVAEPTTLIHRQRTPNDEDRAVLVRAFTAWTGEAIAAEELAQETLLAAWTSRRQPEADAEWRPWLFGVARNVLLRWRREQAKHGRRLAPAPESERHLLAAAATDDLEALVQRRDIVTLLDEALGRLPRETRQALLLKYIEDLPQAEIAARLGVHEKALEGRLHRGKRALHRYLVTERPDSAVSLGIVAEPDTWVTTDLWCPMCGRQRLIGRWSDHHSMRLDCPSCDNGWSFSGRRSHIYSGRISVGGASRAASFARALDDVLQDQAGVKALGRDAAWPCCMCAGTIRAYRYVEPQTEDRFGSPICENIVYRCDRCGTVVGYTWLPGSGGARPEGVAFWHAHQRIRMLPPLLVTWQGRPAIRSVWESLDGAHRYVTHYDAETWRLLDSETDGIPHDAERGGVR